MLTNKNTDSRIDYKTEAPYTVGDFWLANASEYSKKIIRGFSRLNLMNFGGDFVSHIANEMSLTNSHIDLPVTSIALGDVDTFVLNFRDGMYVRGTTGTETGLTRGSLLNTGVYGLDTYVSGVWQDVDGLFWLFSTPDDVFQQFESSVLLQPKYGVVIGDIVPTVILSNEGYLFIGTDFEVVENNLLFFTPLQDLFSGYIHIVSGYRRKISYLGYPFSVDSDCINTNHISSYLRSNNSVTNLEAALSQVVGYASSPADVVPKYVSPIPLGTAIVGPDRELHIFPQELEACGPIYKDSFPGRPVKITTGDSPGFIDYVSTNTIMVLPGFLKDIPLQDKTYACTVHGDFVEIEFGDPGTNTYLNSSRLKYESEVRYDKSGSELTTFSQYLKDKYAPSATNGDVFFVNILREYFIFYGTNVLLVQLSNKLPESAKNKAEDFLQTHTPTNAIILIDKSWD